MATSRCGGSTAYATPLSFVPADRSSDTAGPSDTAEVDELTAMASAVAVDSPLVLAPAHAPASPGHPEYVSVPERASTVSDDAEPAEEKPRPWIVRHWALPVAAVMILVAFLTVRGHLPSLSGIADAFSTADVRWLAIAVVLEAVSNSMFARQQRSLLRSLGVRMSLARALGVTYARSALAISMPAGSAVSAGYALKEYKRSGASTEKATAVMVISGVLSVLGLGALYILAILGLVAARPVQAWHHHPILIGLGAVVVVGLAVWFLLWRVRAMRGTPAAAVTAPPVDGPPAARRFASIRTATRQAVDAWRSLRVRDWSVAGTFAIVNWLADMLCLVAAAQAFNLPVGLVTIAGTYLAVQLVRQIPLTPGGVGLVETGLLAGLVSAGGSTAAAAAVVLTYRVLSCWAFLPLGGLAWLGLRTGSRLDSRSAARSDVTADN